MPDVDTPLGRGYLIEIEGEGAAARAIVALDDSTLRNMSLGGHAKAVFDVLSLPLVEGRAGRRLARRWRAVEQRSARGGRRRGPPHH